MNDLMAAFNLMKQSDVVCNMIQARHVNMYQKLFQFRPTALLLLLPACKRVRRHECITVLVDKPRSPMYMCIAKDDIDIINS